MIHLASGKYGFKKKMLKCVLREITPIYIVDEKVANSIFTCSYAWPSGNDHALVYMHSTVMITALLAAISSNRSQGFEIWLSDFLLIKGWSYVIGSNTVDTMFFVSFIKYLFCANNKHTTFSKITFNFYKAVPQVEARDFKNCYSKLSSSLLREYLAFLSQTWN